MKKCTKCQVQKEELNFYKNKTKKDGFSNICKLCTKSNNQQYYKDNREEQLKRIKSRKEKYKKISLTKYLKYLKSKGCKDCGETNPVVLEFDHRNPEEKSFNIYTKIRDLKWEKILIEIKKCDVRCANCHRIRTSKQQNWYKNIDLGSL